MTWETFFLLLLAFPASYLLARTICKAYFKEKWDYHQSVLGKLDLSKLNKGDKE